MTKTFNIKLSNLKYGHLFSIFMKLIEFHLKDYKDYIEVKFVQEENVVDVKDQMENVHVNYFKIY